MSCRPLLEYFFPYPFSAQLFWFSCLLPEQGLWVGNVNGKELYKKTLIHSPLLLRPNCERLKGISPNITIVNQLRSLLSFIRHNLVLLLRFMHYLADACQCVVGFYSDLLTFLQPWTELFWDFSFNVKRTIALRMSSSHEYFSGVQYCKNKMSWMFSKAFKWTMDSVTKACAHCVCKIQGFPDAESRSNVPNFQRKRVQNGKEGLFRNRVWVTQPRSGRQLERAIDFQRNRTTFPL